MEQVVFFDRQCFRCWRFGYPMHELRIVDVDVARETIGVGSVHVCNDCLDAWKHRDRAPTLPPEPRAYERPPT